jgi:hypothetical protein
MDDERRPLFVHEAVAAPVPVCVWVADVEVALDEPDPPLAADPDGDAALNENSQYRV